MMRTPTLIITVTLTLLVACSTPAAAPATLPSATPEAINQSLAPETIPTTFDRRTMLADLVETAILPAHEDVVESATALERAVAALADEPTASNLETAQSAWRSAAEAWARSEVYGLRFAMLTSNQVKKWPINANQIDNVYRGTYTRLDGTEISGTGLTDVVEAVDPDLNQQMLDLLDQSMAQVNEIYVPFDQAIVLPDERDQVLEAVFTLQDQGDKIAEIASALGLTINTALPE